MSYRPDGWRNPYGGYSEGMLEPTYEAGGDAMLEALRAGGESLMKADVSEVARTLFKGMTQRGTWVFIPDEEE